MMRCEECKSAYLISSTSTFLLLSSYHFTVFYDGWAANISCIVEILSHYHHRMEAVELYEEIMLLSKFFLEVRFSFLMRLFF